MQVNVAGIRRNIKNLAHNYSDPQVKVREATSNDPWGPSATIMAEIADLTYNVVAFSEIMQMIWKRLNDHGKNWRHVYKALILLEYLIKTGTEKVAQQCKENIYAIQTLKEFQYFEEGKDQGLHVREKAKTLVSLLKDDERLKNERTKALKAKERFAQHASGFGSDGSIDGPTLSHRDSPSWRTESEASRSASELEYVRPQTVGEEELQLQLAMAMSREEAEQEEAKRRSDDVRLQLALSQSEQDFKKQSNDPLAKPPPNQSHLMDLLDISLGATSISGPSQASDPWGMPSAKQTSDPWGGRASPATDPWNTNTGAISRQPLQSLAGASNVETWIARNHSPSIASGSSNEGWLQNNPVTTANGNGNGTSNPSQLGVDPWLTKPSTKPEQPDPWLNKTPDTNSDAWQPASSKSGVVDPWAPASSNMGSRPSPIGAQTSPNSDYDEFDVISNRAKTQNTNSNNNNINNNTSNALLDEMDPLAASKNASTRKTPQSFLGENSALVNLDQLIKTTNPTNSGQVAYNPFGDMAQPPKTNLFQQQMQPVPSINQLKQSPFPVCISQDPWAPANNSSQYVATNVDEHTQDVHEYDENDNYDDVFDTKHVDDIQIRTSPAYNSNYKLYFDDEYHDFNQISQICVDSERNNINNNNRNNTTGNNTNINNNTAAPWLNPEVAASNPFLS
ncbi:epsin-2 isoform X5 [Contarinia nasturtii]|nr:epsin-2 isoform X5 [Contarinia nasturtii]XP_031631758.1 epsin-2 isoform X5 [Contarinia nasturtii]XP_031631759.1 epsin-2 isoform X5 [Contarinia nasturtii]